MTGDNVLLRQLLITAGCCPKSTETIGRVSVSWSPRTCHAGPVCHPHSPSIPCTLSSRVIVGALWMLLLPTYLPTYLLEWVKVVRLFFFSSWILGVECFEMLLRLWYNSIFCRRGCTARDGHLGAWKKSDLFLSARRHPNRGMFPKGNAQLRRGGNREWKKYCLMIVFFFRNWQLFFNWTLLNRENTLFGWCLVAARWRHALPRRELIRLPFNRSHTMQRVGVSVVCSDIS